MNIGLNIGRKAGSGKGVASEKNTGDIFERENNDRTSVAA